MYYMLERELKKKGVTRERLAKELGVSVSTISCKLNDRSEFTIKECKKIKNFLEFSGTMDELFISD